MAAKLFKHAELPLYKRVLYLTRAVLDYSKQTNTRLLSFYFYNMIQIPVFIIMVLSIRKISTENEDLTGAGMLWFKNLNEPDAYLLLPLIATVLNYFNLGVSCLLWFCREASPKTMSIGSSTGSVLSSRFCNSSTCHSPINGRQAHSFTGSVQAFL